MSEAKDHLEHGEDIAIVGMSCMVPGADTPGRFWENIVHKVDSIIDAPPDWQPELFYDPAGPKVDKTYTKRGGFLGDLCRFNPVKYGTVPNAVDGAEPDQFIALRCAYEALADAGYPQVPLNRERTGVIMGRGIFVNRGWFAVFQKTFAIDQALNVLKQLEPHRSDEEIDLIRRSLKANLPPVNADTFPGLVHSALVGRIANRLDLMGPAYTVDCACSSSLVAVQNAIAELRAGRCDCVLAGGTQVSIPAPIYIMFCHIEAVSKTGRIAPFSAEAAGTMLGQGCGLVVLKRRSDAERDGNRIYALVKTVGTSSDGKGAGLLAPRTEGQQLAIHRAYEQSGIPTDTIELVEAHGTGIPLGDATEVGSLVKCFGGRKGPRSNVAIGSVKSNVGHLVPASGTAALIKTALSLYHRVLPPTLHAEKEQPGLKLSETPFYVCNEPRPWLHGEKSYPRRAGINAFGFGGINAHAILEEYPVADERQLPRLNVKWPVELVVISAADRTALQKKVSDLAGWIGRSKELRLLDIAASCASETGASRVAIVAKSVEDLAKKLGHVARLLAEPGREKIQDRNGIYWYEKPLAREGRVAFVMPGEGAQYPNMLEEVSRHFPEVRRQFELTDLAFRRRYGQSLAHVMFPQPRDLEAAERELFKMDLAVAVVTAAERGLIDLLQTLGVKSSAVMGHSSGEFGAILASGAYRPADEEELIRSIVDGTNSTAQVAESNLVSKAVLIAVGGAEPKAVEEAVAACRGGIEVAIDNCPHQVVLAGDDQSAAKALEILKGRGGLCQIIPWDRAYHTESFAPVCRFVDEYFGKVQLRKPDVELWSCATAQPFPSEPAAIRELAVRQWKSCVRFRETVQNMYDAGVRVFLEVGPRGNLSAFVADTLAGKPHAAVAMDSHQRGGLDQLCRAVGMLAAHGVDARLEALYERRSPRRLDFSVEPPAPPAPEPILKLELPLLVVGDDAVKTWDSGRPATAEPASATVPMAAGTETVADPRARAFADFQRTMQTFLQTQEAVMQARRGVVPPRPAPAAVPAPAPARPPVAPQPRRTPAAAPAAVMERATKKTPRPLPFIDVVLENDPGTRVVAEVEIDIEKHRFLLDHTFFGRNLSKRDPKLTPLPIVPMALTMELMAEAAQTLFPDLCVTAVTDLVASRWLTMETPTRRVRMVAEPASPESARVQVFEADREGMHSEIASATIELAAAPADLGPARLSCAAKEPPPWPLEDLYGKVLYHGATFRGIEKVDRLDKKDVDCALREPDVRLLVPEASRGEPLLPVQLIDTASQIPGLVNANWAAIGQSCTLAFPTKSDRLEFTPHRPTDGVLRAVSTTTQDEKFLTSDTEVVGSDGRVVLRYLGKREEIVHFPLGPYLHALAPAGIWCSRDLADQFRQMPGIDKATIRVADRAGDKLLVNRFWAQIMARLTLDRTEREQFNNSRVSAPPVALAGWLLGRIVAKDAVRALLGDGRYLMDVGIRTGASGHPAADLEGGQPVSLSLSHKGFRAVAAAARSADVAGIGIETELIGGIRPEAREDAFDATERALMTQISKASGIPADELTAAGWCAKESVRKALDAETAVVQLLDCDARSRKWTCSAAGNSGSIDVWWAVDGDAVTSLCLLKR